MTESTAKFEDLRNKTQGEFLSSVSSFSPHSFVHSDDLDAQTEQLRQQLATAIHLRPNQIANLRQSIARIQIVKNQKIKENLRELYRDQPHKPKDLRPKKTRAMRRELTNEEKSITLKKTQRRNFAFPQRNFTLKTTEN